MNSHYSDPKGPAKVLIVEDSSEIQDAIGLIFDLHWPEAKITKALGGAEGITAAKSQSPDLIILDLGLPDLDGMRVLKEIRDGSDVPVIILTVRGDEMDRVRGLECGADDYIVKPFGHKELLARIKTVMQRNNSQTDAAPQKTLAGRVKIDFADSTVFKDSMPVKMTTTELNLLRYLALHADSVLSETDILREVWGEDYTDCNEYLEAYIRRLHEKLEDDYRNPKIILKEGIGYKFNKNAI
jgi:two-component system, OmpR family, KDP operon response regulator KdpE